jgi:hypothetical protein
VDCGDSISGAVEIAYASVPSTRARVCDRDGPGSRLKYALDEYFIRLDAEEH